ncbi:FecR family protein [Parapedobacter tibetensis]|uniref:FecR family protein n=1 Tax=Parapedobacter tibetensis TaxID=2972951 RepID=UPI00214D4932|nr:FecR family protein [Parapedobacter tibetensis]
MDTFSNFRIATLIAKRHANALKPAEREELVRWLVADVRHRELYARLLDKGYVAKGIRVLDEADTESALHNVNARLDKPRIRPRGRRIIFFRSIAAAILLAVVGITVYSVMRDRWLAVGEQAADIAAGGNQATLTLANGRTIDLSSEQSGIIVGDGITYTDGSFVISPEVGKSKSRKVGKSDLLSISTPKGGTYQITLPDGTQVWLNAASILRYPSKFDDKERVVELEGEAYFQVSSQLSAISSQPSAVGNKENQRSSPQSASSVFHLPFLVKTQAQTVEVLGTQFNILAYPDEPDTKTTLLEGSVRVMAGIDNPITLNPGQQAQTPNLTGRSKDLIMAKTRIINNPDIDKVLAWKNGLFNFDGASLEEIMRQLERWYDIEVVYEKGIPDLAFIGEIERSLSLSEVLKGLKMSGVHFRLESGRRLIVLP